MSALTSLLSLGLFRRKVHHPVKHRNSQIFYIRFEVVTEKCKYLKVGMKVVLNEEWKEYAWVVVVHNPTNTVTLQPLYPKEYTNEEKANFPLRAVHDTK